MRPVPRLYFSSEPAAAPSVASLPDWQWGQVVGNSIGWTGAHGLELSAMLPDHDVLSPPEPRRKDWLPCPACGRYFRDEQGRGGHLRHSKDPFHAEYRAKHGFRALVSEGSGSLILKAEHGTQEASLPVHEVDVDVPAESRPLLDHDLQPEVSGGPETFEEAPESQESEQARLDADWSDPVQAAGALAAMSQAMATTPPRPDLSLAGRVVCVLVILGLSTLALYLIIQAKRDTNRNATRDSVTVASKRRALSADAAYWRDLLGPGVVRA